MKPGTLILRTFLALTTMLVAAFVGAFIFHAAGFAGETGLIAGALASVVPPFPGVLQSVLPQIPNAYWPNRVLLDWMVKDTVQQGWPEILPLPGYIRAENVLGVQNNIQFEIAENVQVAGQAQSPVENRLRQNDAFYVTHYSVMFYTFVTATGNPARAAARLQTFPNLDVFGLNTPSVVAAYNGKLSLRVNDTVYMDSLDMTRFMNAHSAQEGLAVSAVAVTGVMDTSDWSQNDMFAHLIDPLVRLNGMFNNRFAIQLPDNVSFSLVAGSSVAAVLYLRGWLMQNGGGQRAIK